MFVGWEVGCAVGWCLECWVVGMGESSWGLEIFRGR